MEENVHARPQEGGGGRESARAHICMIAESPSGTERFAAPAMVAEEGGVPVYTFAHDGARFCICAGEPLRVAREGEIAYELALDPRAESDAVIRSPFGEIPVRVRTLRAERVREGERFALDCAYLLDFSGELQRHRLRFTVRPQAAEKEGKDDR